MTLERRRFLRRALRRQLMHLLGGPVCAHCGSTSDLCFDLIKPALDDKHHRFNGYDRVKFYFREHSRGNVQVLCDTCNSRKGQAERPF